MLPSNSTVNPSKKLLLLEDHADNKELFSVFLVSKGYVVYPSCTLSGAISIIKEHPLDLLIIDLNLEVGCGLELLAAYTEYQNNHPGVLIISALTQEEIQCQQEQYKVLEATTLQKPFSLSSLGQEVSRLLSR